MKSEQSIINFENVFFTYPKKPALEGINLSVMEGEFLAVMGENGAGKTTLCKLINGIVPHFSGGQMRGTVTVDGINTRETSVSRLAYKVGIVLDDPDAQVFSSTVFNEVAFGPENICLPPQEIEQRVSYALAAVGLCGFEDRIPATLSGGEKQRLSIAAALAMKGKILVLDEPLCHLDPQGEKDFMSVLSEIKKQNNITIVMVSHNSDLMLQYADRVCVLKDGYIIALESAKNIFSGSLPEEYGIQPLCIDENIIYDDSAEVNQNVIPAVEFKNFCFSYTGILNIENLNLSILENDFIAIIGNNGCGKTTLLKNITGLLRPYSGDIFIRGRNTKDLSVSDISKEAGFVMQNPDNQLFTDSVYKEVTFALKNNRLSKIEIKKRAEDALKTVGLDAYEVFLHILSKSDRARTVLACVLAMQSKILLFDEIDAGNDYRGCLQIMNIMKDLNKRGFTIIFVTHNMSLAYRYANRIIKMDKKGIVFDRRRH